MRRTALLLLIGACSIVTQHRVRPDYDAVDRTRTVRLVVLVTPIPQGGAVVGDLVGLITQRYANHHRDFIVRGHRVADSMPGDACTDGVEGVLHVSPMLDRQGEDVDASVRARLTRCRDGQEVWSASGEGSWQSRGEHVAELTDSYVAELGETVRPYVAPSFHLLRAVLDTLPRPELPDDDAVMEKIELGE
jgi:probable lipoprotein (TIGR04455 family)